MVNETLETPDPAASTGPRARSGRWWRWALLFGYWGLLFTLTHLPPARLPLTGVPDKWLHAGAYAGLALLLLLATMPKVRHVGLLLALVAAYGAADELLQIPVGRTAELGDWLADVAGAAVVMGAYVGWRIVLQRRRI